MDLLKTPTLHIESCGRFPEWMKAIDGNLPQVIGKCPP
jgi:hypothetical protein